jgi:hypothetical protein
MSRRHHHRIDQHRSCPVEPSSSSSPVTSEGTSRVPLQENVIESTSGVSGVLSDTDSGVADTASEDGAAMRPGSSKSEDNSSSRRKQKLSTGAIPKQRTDNQQASTSSPSASTAVDLQTLRDPSHYEELSVIGNGEHISIFRDFFDFVIVAVVAESKIMGSSKEDKLLLLFTLLGSPRYDPAPQVRKYISVASCGSIFYMRTHDYDDTLTSHPPTIVHCT